MFTRDDQLRIGQLDRENVELLISPTGMMLSDARNRFGQGLRRIPYQVLGVFLILFEVGMRR
jgi:hypothetical protein